MQSFSTRAGRWPLAFTLIALAAACADDAPTAAPSISRASRNALAGNVILVTNGSGANVPGSLQWAVGIADGTSVIQFDASPSRTSRSKGPRRRVSRSRRLPVAYSGSARAACFAI
jgi:hypothetical protein